MAYGREAYHSHLEHSDQWIRMIRREGLGHLLPSEGDRFVEGPDKGKGKGGKMVSWYDEYPYRLSNAVRMNHRFFEWYI